MDLRRYSSSLCTLFALYLRLICFIIDSTTRNSNKG
jgi:hypothetical protein